MNQNARWNSEIFYVLFEFTSEKYLGWKVSFNISKHTYVFLFC